MAPRDRVEVDLAIPEVIRELIQAQTAMVSNQRAQSETFRHNLESAVAAMDRVVALQPKQASLMEELLVTTRVLLEHHVMAASSF